MDSTLLCSHRLRTLTSGMTDIDDDESYAAQHLQDMLRPQVRICAFTAIDHQSTLRSHM
jgi:hypothetical protein